jgi:hypothetical protein
MLSSTNILRKKVEEDLKKAVSVNISFELIHHWGINLEPALPVHNIQQLEELLGDDKRFSLDNSMAILVVKYKDDRV